MATYGYSTPYTGQRQPTLPPGYMEAATAPGRNIAAGIQQFAAGLGQTIQRYQANKAETEAATQTFETLSGMAQQALATDPQYQAIQQYYETGQLPAGVTENDLKRFETKVQADRSMLNKMAGIGEKFGDMSLAKKKAAIGDMAMVLGQYQNRATEDLKRRQLEVQSSIQQETLNRMRQETQGGADFIAALGEVSQMVPGQPTQTPYASPTAEILSRYGRNLSPAQAQALAEQIQIRTQQPPVDLIPSEATFKTPGGGQVTYAKPVSTEVTSVPVPETNMVQPMVNGKPVGSPIKQSTANKFGQEFDSLSESQQKFVESQWNKLNSDKTIIEYREALSAFNEMAALNTSKVITPADSLAMVYKFMKSLDPGSIVRETEVGLVVESGSIPQAIVQRLNQALTGNLTEEKRKMLLDASKKAMSGKVQSVNSLLDTYSKQSEKLGIPSKFTTEALRENVASQDFGVTQAVQLPRFQSVQEADANLEVGQSAMVLDPSTRKYREFIKQ